MQLKKCPYGYKKAHCEKFSLSAKLYFTFFPVIPSPYLHHVCQIHICDLPCDLLACNMTPQDHLKEWFTESRRALISGSALDRLSSCPKGTFSRFLANDPSVPLTRLIYLYYPALALLGYVPPIISTPLRGLNLTRWAAERAKKA